LREARALYAVLAPVEVLLADDSTSCDAVEMIARSIILFLFRDSGPLIGHLTEAGPLAAFRPQRRCLLGDLAIIVNVEEDFSIMEFSATFENFDDIGVSSSHMIGLTSTRYFFGKIKLTETDL
jgi:hypothetical protein